MSCVKSSAGFTVLSLASRRYVGLNFRGARGESASSVWHRARLSFLAHLRLTLSSFIPLRHTEPPDSWKTPSRFKAFLPVCLGPQIALLMSAFTFASRLWECNFNIALRPWLGWVCYSYTSCLLNVEQQISLESYPGIHICLLVYAVSWIVYIFNMPGIMLINKPQSESEM